MAVYSPYFDFDVAYQPQVAQFAVAQPNEKAFRRASRSFQALRSPLLSGVTISAISFLLALLVGVLPYTIHYVAYRMQRFFFLSLARASNLLSPLRVATYRIARASLMAPGKIVATV